MKIYPDHEPIYKGNEKPILIQVGMTFYSIFPYIKIEDTKDLPKLLDKYDVRFLKQKEY